MYQSWMGNWLVLNANGPRGDANFADEVQRQQYRLGLSQILTKNLLLGLSFETITDEGFLNNPYRQVRYVDPTTPQGYSYEREIYPRTRTSDARPSTRRT